MQPDEASKTTGDSLRIIRKAGTELVENKRLAILAEKASASEIEDKDILSLLSKSTLVILVCGISSSLPC
jgi:hypothetical protein